MNVYEHPEYLALLAAAESDPDDRLVAGVLADWLDEHGEHGTAGLWRSGFIPRVLRANRATADAFRSFAPALAKVAQALAPLAEVFRQLPPVGRPVKQEKKPGGKGKKT